MDNMKGIFKAVEDKDFLKFNDVLKRQLDDRIKAHPKIIDHNTKMARQKSISDAFKKIYDDFKPAQGSGE